eukprot:c17378_g1_i1.p1 GENE.c17378_g1_i1~~c17378_g1_i1.p1  ORF type:complete len:1050 (+),score=228.75 c17378_g1_i1:205-3150(+)
MFRAEDGVLCVGTYKNGLFVNGELHYVAGDIYEGDVDEQGWRHGKGKHTYGTGDVYEGDWVNNKRHGRGVQINADGSRYEGEWAEGKFHGQGVLSSNAGGLYSGGWDHARKSGYGVQVYAKGGYYWGEWRDNKREGHGKGVEANGETYIGKWLDGRRHGTGVCYFATAANSEISLQILNGEQGVGHRSFGVYRGEWAKGLRSGMGEYVDEDGNTYIGEWVKDKMEGFGEYVSANGDTYQGQFSKNKRVGRGRFTEKSTPASSESEPGKPERVYSGEFDDGTFGGLGRMTIDGKGTLEGVWREGDLNGMAQFTGDVTTLGLPAAGGQAVYYGRLSNKLFNGIGVLRVDAGHSVCVARGQWQDGKLHGVGEWLVQPSNEALLARAYVGEWAHGLKSGVARWSGGCEGEVESDSVADDEGKEWGIGRPLEHASDPWFFVGEWENNQPSGAARALMTHATGQQPTVMFEGGLSSQAPRFVACGLVDSVSLVSEPPFADTDAANESLQAYVEALSQKDLDGAAAALVSVAAWEYHPVDYRDNQLQRFAGHKSSLYVGTVAPDFKRDGLGAYFSAEGVSYSGEFSANQRHGVGYFAHVTDDDSPVRPLPAFVTASGAWYLGQWEHDKRSGIGAEGTDTSVYIGRFSGDKYSVQGAFVRRDRSRQYNGAVDEHGEGSGFAQVVKWNVPEMTSEPLVPESETPLDPESPAVPQRPPRDELRHPLSVGDVTEVLGCSLPCKLFSVDVKQVCLESGANWAYCGVINAGTLKGIATSYLLDKYVQTGEFERELSNGVCERHYDNGSKYAGECVNDIFHGVGRFDDATDGTYYTGSWVDGQRHGGGKQSLVSGEAYIGLFTNDARTGKGKMQYASGEIYKGNYVDGVVNGTGLMIATDGTLYSGHWTNAVRDGHGTQLYSNGDEYVGFWKNNKREGRGTQVYADGSRYEGLWSNDMRNGIGLWTGKNGSTYEGEWLDDKRAGVGKSVAKNTAI